jgi:ribosomal protein RSM22 (predicted rRNA methylase)
MELPPALRQAVDQALDGVSLADLAAAASRISQRYRAEIADGRFHISDDLAARAYLATRLPATYAAIRAAFAMVAKVRPDLAPATLLDVGAGPGTALWAARDCWPALDDALLIEGAAPMRHWGERLASSSGLSRIEWRSANITAEIGESKPRDIVTLSYVLSELTPEQRSRLVDRLWSLTGDTLVIVEPGTPAGWARILAARGRLLAAGAHMLAPCPHAAACPLVTPDWCHFSRRVARSRLHRQAKGGEVPWEDEKYSFVAVSRRAGKLPLARVIAPAYIRSGQVTLKLCTETGAAAERHWSKRDGEAFKTARRLDWGDAMNSHQSPPPL